MAGWSTVGGSWSVVNDGSNKILSQSGSGEAIAVAGDTDWTDYTFSGRVRINSAAGNAGLVFRYTDASNFYMFRLNNNADTVDLYQRVGGTLTPVVSQQWYTLTVTVAGDHIMGSVDGMPRIDWTASSGQLISGKAGFRVHTTQADFDDAFVASS